MSGLGYQREEERRAREGMPALYPSVCVTCGDPINMGDRIVKVVGKYKNRYAHVACRVVGDE